MNKVIVTTYQGGKQPVIIARSDERSCSIKYEDIGEATIHLCAAELMQNKLCVNGKIHSGKLPNNKGWAHIIVEE